MITIMQNYRCIDTFPNPTKFIFLEYKSNWQKKENNSYKIQFFIFVFLFLSLTYYPNNLQIGCYRFYTMIAMLMDLSAKIKEKNFDWTELFPIVGKTVTKFDTISERSLSSFLGLSVKILNIHVIRKLASIVPRGERSYQE